MEPVFCLPQPAVDTDSKRWGTELEGPQLPDVLQAALLVTHSCTGLYKCLAQGATRGCSGQQQLRGPTALAVPWEYSRAKQEDPELSGIYLGAEAEEEW